MAIPPKLYHVTNEACWKQIQATGLMPRKDRPKGEPLWPYEGHFPNPDDVVFMDSEIIVAFNYQVEAYDDPVVVEIDSRDLDPALFDVNCEVLEHLLEDEEYMYNSHDTNLGPILKADPAYADVAGQGEGALEMLKRAQPATRAQLLEAALEHGHTIMYRGLIGTELILGTVTQADADAAYKEWESSLTDEQRQEHGITAEA